MGLAQANPSETIERVHPFGGRFEINWPHLIARRELLLQTTELPAYLLLPEIHTILNAAAHGNEHLMLSVLWHTGARVSEMLALTRKSFTLADEWGSHVLLETLKKRGRPTLERKAVKPRVVPITDAALIVELERYFAMNPLRKDERIFPVTRQAVDKRIKQILATLPPFGIAVSAHTFRHSFACNAVLHGTPLTVIRDWLGHANTAATEIYTQVLSTETHHLMQRIEF